MINGVELDNFEITELRGQLDSERDRLKEEIVQELHRNEGTDYGVATDSVRDGGEESVADLYRDLSFAGIERHIGRLRSVESAIYRIKKDVYGVCADCAEPIDKARLQADPAVLRCLVCQTRREHKPSAKDPTPSL